MKAIRPRSSLVLNNLRCWVVCSWQTPAPVGFPRSFPKPQTHQMNIIPTLVGPSCHGFLSSTWPTLPQIIPSSKHLVAYWKDTGLFFSSARSNQVESGSSWSPTWNHRHAMMWFDRTSCKMSRMMLYLKHRSLGSMRTTLYKRNPCG